MENITKKEFIEYLCIRDSGRVNMFDLRNVVLLSAGVLSVDKCKTIMSNFEKLGKKFKINID